MKLISELLKLLEADIVAPDEEDKPKKSTKTKTQTDISRLGVPRIDQLPSTRGRTDPTVKTDAKNAVSRDTTSRATRDIPLDPRAAQHLADLHANFPDDGAEDEHVEPIEPPPPETLPKVISHDMKVAGFLEPDFHIVANLPGNMSRAIRQMGAAVFRSMTTTPVDKITTIAHVMGHGPNTKAELNAVANYLKKHGRDLGPGEVDFEASMPGYKAKIHNFEANGIHFHLVKDDFGEYIYCWPAESTLGFNGKDTKKLR